MSELLLSPPQCLCLTLAARRHSHLLSCFPSPAGRVCCRAEAGNGGAVMPSPALSSPCTSCPASKAGRERLRGTLHAHILEHVLGLTVSTGFSDASSHLIFPQKLIKWGRAGGHSFHVSDGKNEAGYAKHSAKQNWSQALGLLPRRPGTCLAHGTGRRLGGFLARSTPAGGADGHRHPK